MPFLKRLTVIMKSVDSWNKSLNQKLNIVDPEINELIQLEKERQFSCLELIASENFTSEAVMEANGSVLTNKYSEGLPGARYYGGNEHIDKIENLCRIRALNAFNLNEDWGVNVQPYSGSQANFAALTALLAPGERFMGLDLPSGGHLTHGYQTAKRKISASAMFFESLPYKVSDETGLIDYDRLEDHALSYRPKLIICGASAYPRDWDYRRLRAIADQHNAFLMADVAHISGLVAKNEQNNPFDYAHVVTTTTHKTLRGPRAGIIFFNKDLEKRVNDAVFPALQGGPHNNTIAAVAVALKLVMEPEFKQYAIQVKRNALALSKKLQDLGHKIITGGTDNHIVLWDLRPLLTGDKLEYVCDKCSITVNKNTVHGDKSAFVPGGIRLGTPALTSRSFKEKDFEQVAIFLHSAFLIAKKQPDLKFREFVAQFDLNDVKSLKQEVELFAKQFPFY